MSQTEAASVSPARRGYALGRLRGDVLVYARLASTNVTLRALAASGAGEGTVVVADEQRAGRGRLGRSWHSPAGAGFYGSILLRPETALRDAQFLTFAAAIAVAETLGALGATGAEIKWPNDVLLGGRKVCGILTETSSMGDRLEWAIIGIGINLKHKAVPPELADRATSLEQAGVLVSAADMLPPLLAALDRWYAVLLESGGGPILARWEALAPMARGRRVLVDADGERYEATTRGLAPDGLLRVERIDGTQVDLAAAEVSIRG